MGHLHKYKKIMYDTSLSGARILCVDDDEDARNLTAAMLSGYQLTFASNGYEAIRSLNSEVFDLYLLDHWLPDWSGIQLCRHIRRSDPRVPVVFCTGAARDEDRRRAMNAGANAFLVKPIDPLQLREQVRSLVTAANLESLRARVEEERAIQEELDRRAEEMKQRSATALEAARAAIERATRIKALKVFLDAGGTLGNFERAWSPTYTQVWAQHRDNSD
jgi:CheY-like chemotaxis protein